MVRIITLPRNDKALRTLKRTQTDIPVPKEGDIYYKTVRTYPSIPEIPEEIAITITKNLDQFGRDFTLKRAQAERKEAESRDSNSPTHPDRPEFGR